MARKLDKQLADKMLQKSLARIAKSGAKLDLDFLDYAALSGSPKAILSTP